MLGLFKKKPLLSVDGLVARIGPWMGPGEINGTVLLLEGIPKPFIVLRDSQQASATWLGLTSPGDEVTFVAKEADDTYSVSLSTFCNKTLESGKGAA